MQIYALGWDGYLIYPFFGLGPNSERRPKYQQAFSSPVIRVFDVVKSIASTTEPEPTTFVVLPQPILPSRELAPFDGLTFVGCTETGGYYALSERSYPYVTDGAPDATCYSRQLEWPTFTLEERQKTLMGIHRAHYSFDESYLASLPAPTPISQGEKPAKPRPTPLPIPSSPSLKSSRLINFAKENLVDLSILFPIVSALIYYFLLKQPGVAGSVKVGMGRGVSDGVGGAATGSSAGDVVQGVTPETELADVILGGTPDGIPSGVANEASHGGPHGVSNGAPNGVPNGVPNEVSKGDEKFSQVASPEGLVQAEDGVGEGDKIPAVRFVESKPDVATADPDPAALPTPAVTPKKKKAHRGQRGGARKRGKANSAEKDKLDLIVHQAKEIQRELPLEPDIRVLSSEGLGNDVDPSSVVIINNLMVNEDKVLGKFPMVHWLRQRLTGTNRDGKSRNHCLQRIF